MNVYRPGTALGISNMLITEEHPADVLQQAPNAQHSIAIPVIQELMRGLIVLGQHGPAVARRLQANRLPNLFQHDADFDADLAKAIKQSAADATKAKKRPRQNSSGRYGDAGASGSGSNKKVSQDPPAAPKVYCKFCKMTNHIMADCFKLNAAKAKKSF